MIKPEARLKLIDGSAYRTTHSLKHRYNAVLRTKAIWPEPNLQDIYYFNFCIIDLHYRFAGSISSIVPMPRHGNDGKFPDNQTIVIRLLATLIKMTIMANLGGVNPQAQPVCLQAVSQGFPTLW